MQPFPAKSDVVSHTVECVLEADTGGGFSELWSNFLEIMGII